MTQIAHLADRRRVGSVEPMVASGLNLKCGLADRGWLRLIFALKTGEKRMRRREFAKLVAATISWPMMASTQGPMAVIGFLTTASPDRFAPYMAAIRRGLREAGYVEGQNLAIEYRWAEGNDDRLPALAADLVSLKVDAIITTGGTVSAHAAKYATSTIPIVSITGVDPIAAGLIESFARPGGNLTGVSIITVERTAKRIELLTEWVPRLL